MTRISEADLIIPALYVIQKQPGITTGELINELRNIFKPTGEDAEILQGRGDDKFSQIVRNLVSHHTLDHRFGYTTLNATDTAISQHILSEKGYIYLQQNLESLESLLSNNFSYPETLDGVTKISDSQNNGRKITIFDENIFISEGRKKTVKAQVYERSKLLRDAAVDFYTKNSKIICEVCGFDFYEAYGNLGLGYIEIHHQKPIYQYEDTDFPKLIKEAIKDLIPLCSNCHRMIHRRRDKPFTIKELKEVLTNRQV